LIFLIFGGAYSAMFLGSWGQVGLIFNVAFREDDLTRRQSWLFQARVVGALMAAVVPAILLAQHLHAWI
jgi:hypothetical protein